MATEGIERPVGALHADTASLAAAAAAAGGDHVALIADGSVDEWHGAVSAAGGAPTSSYLVSVDDTVRGAAAGTVSPGGRHVGGGVVLATVEAPVADPAAYLAAVLSECAESGTGTVVVDDLSALLPDDADAMETVGRLVETAAEFGLTFHARVAGDGPVVSALARRLPGADADADRALAERLVAHLRETDPTNFGYLRRHWVDARRGLAAVDMTYPQSKQVHAALPDTDTTPRTLGAALQALVKLGALGVWGDTVAANRYDLTGYDAARIDAVGAVLDDLAD
ncbi:hypothetical protein [Halobaculum lipolyticum]|uniref:Uncharacterized protein n=1 Tax=Halobaculum lipolyticum TaxID=3032001 RepID=A0ABD5WDX2_9EURY|nr:hypothetical protein [Halobaculum sp. DT31]